MEFNIQTDSEKRATISLDRNAVKSVATAASARGVSCRDIVHILTPFLEQNGVSTEEIHISNSSVNRWKKKAASNGAIIHRERVKEALASTDLPIVVLFDGKQINEITGQQFVKRERLGVSCSIDGEIFLLGIPPIESSASENQVIGLDKIFDDYNLPRDKIGGVVVDTTAFNTGPNKGSVGRLERELNRSLPMLACRRHVQERHIAHFREIVSTTKSTGPSNPLFTRLLKNWNNIKMSVDLTKLNRIKLWHLNEEDFLKKKANRSIRFYEQILREGVFERGNSGRWQNSA